MSDHTSSNQSRLVADLGVLRSLSDGCRAASEDLRAVAHTVDATGRPSGIGRLDRLMCGCDEAGRQAVGHLQEIAGDLEAAARKLTLAGEALAVADSEAAQAVSDSGGRGAGSGA